MKFVIIILCCIAAVSIDCLTDAYIARIKSLVDQCQANPTTRVPDEWLDLKVLEKNAEQAGPHILCRLQKLGTIKENGDVDAAALRKDLLDAFEDPTKVDKAVTKCARREPNWSAEKTAIENFKCVLNFN
uniref:Odorant-binding protein n=1 Tax=Galeruca daurica TaxID=1651263 RepID=A0A1U9W505_9CUCU|nr:odorant-binding protein [Galeruca daurica]